MCAESAWARVANGGPPNFRCLIAFFGEHSSTAVCTRTSPSVADVNERTEMEQVYTVHFFYAGSQFIFLPPLTV